jgi:hypothetical protein
VNKNKKMNEIKKKRNKIKNYSEVFFDKNKFHKKYNKFKNFFIFLWNFVYFNSKYNKNLKYLIKFRREILSEEEMFKNHFFINSLNRIIFIND